jgi:hypothetical protein
MFIGNFLKTASSTPALLGLLLISCTLESGEQIVADHAGWTRIQDASDDPFDDRESADPSCPLSSYGAEGTIFEIETGTCEYATFRQDMLVPIGEGDQLTYLVWHLNLWDETAGRAHMAIQLEDWTVWDLQVDIPADAEVYEGQVEAPHDIAEGVAYLHLHNHGVNNWRVSDLTSVEP